MLRTYHVIVRCGPAEVKDALKRQDIPAAVEIFTAMQLAGLYLPAHLVTSFVQVTCGARRWKEKLREEERHDTRECSHPIER